MKHHADPFAPDALAELDSRLVAANVREEPDHCTSNVLALDLGTQMGWALRTQACVTSGSKSWSDKRGETRGHRLLRLYRWLNSIQSAESLGLVAFEQVQFHNAGARGGMLAAHAYAQFEGVVLMFAARWNIATLTVHTSTLKKAVTGKGKWPKGEGKQKIAGAVRELGYDFDTQDEADALAVLQWATRIRGAA